MNDQIVVKDKTIREAIKKYYPKVDLNKPMKRSDFDTLLRGIEWKQKGAEINKRMNDIKRKGIIAGSTVTDSEGNVFIVTNIRLDGYICLKGKKGGFSPVYLTKV